MPGLFGAPAPLSGTELVTVHQIQNGNVVRCSMTLIDLLAWVQAQSAGMTQAQFNAMANAWVASLPTTEPPHGPFLNGGVLSDVP